MPHNDRQRIADDELDTQAQPTPSDAACASAAKVPQRLVFRHGQIILEDDVPRRRPPDAKHLAVDAALERVGLYGARWPRRRPAGGRR